MNSKTNYQPFHQQWQITEKRFLILTFRCRMISSLQIHYADIKSGHDE
jgi:hypothetical protein